MSKVLVRAMHRILGRVPLQVVLTVPVILQILVATGIVGYLAHRHGQQMVRDLANQLMAQAGDRVNQHLDSYLAIPEHINQINADAIALGLLDLQDFETAGHYFWQQMQTFPSVSYISYTLANGDYAGAGGFLYGQGITIDERSPRTQGITYTYETDSQGNRANVVAVYDDYDPLTEDSYTDAVEAGRPVWIAPYNWDDAADYISIGASYPIYDRNQTLRGVIGVDLLLSSIDDFLDTLQISPSAQVLIMDRSGLLIASSMEEGSFRINQGVAERLNIEESDDPVLRASAQHLRDTLGDFQTIYTPQSFQLFLNRERYFVQVTPWHHADVLNWLVVVVIPEQDIIAQTQQNTRNTVLLSMGVFLIAIQVSIWMSRWVINPVHQIKQATQAIANGDFNAAIDLNRTDELGTLAQSFNTMAERVNTALSELQKTNEALTDREQQLQDYNQTLEQQVQERTQALSQKTTELQRLLKELRHTQVQIIQNEKMADLGLMVAGIAHEINNPVHFIYGNLSYIHEYSHDLLDLVQIYHQHVPNPPPDVQARLDAIDLEFLSQDLDKVLRSIEVGTERIRKIVLSLRNFSRLDESDFKAVDIHEGIDNTLLLLHHRLKAKMTRPDIQVIKTYGVLPKVECYAGQLNQVFMNLISNAIDALEESNQNRSFEDLVCHPNQIQICTFVMEGDRVGIQISDNGAGMSEQARSCLFQPFFAKKLDKEGTGLGLSLSHQIIVENHKGSLQCESSLGQGTTFTIAIPIHPSNVHQPPETPASMFM